MLGQLLGKIGWSDLPASFNFSIKELISQAGPFNIHNGINKSTKETVTVFVCDKKGDARTTQFAVAAMKRAKSLKHPSFVKVIETADVSSGVYVVTEQVVPLELYDIDSTRELFPSSLTWNLYVLADGIAFLHQTVKAYHGAICPKSVFVTRHGEWKIGGLDLCRSRDDLNVEPALLDFSVGGAKRLASNHQMYSVLWGSDRLRNIYPSEALDDKISPVVLDRIGFASLAAWAYARAGNTRADPSAIPWKFELNERRLPENLLRMCKRFMDTNTYRIEHFDWDQMKAKAPYFRDSDLVQCMLFFMNIPLKGNWDKEIFFEKTLPGLIEAKKLSNAVQVHLVLPRIILELETAVIPPPMLPTLVQLFVGGISLIESTEIFQRDAYSCYHTLMLSNERSIRYCLLQSLPQYQRHITQANALQLFEAVAIGLSDSSPELRDVTLRAMLFFVPKVAHDRGCLDRGFKRMSRCLQTDEAPFIRTNAIICFAKLIESSNANVIQEYIAPQFLIGMRDNFSPAKLAALQGLCACVSHLKAKDKALKYLPALCPRLLDEDPQIQAIAFQALDMMTSSLKAETLHVTAAVTTPPTTGGSIKGGGDLRISPSCPPSSFPDAAMSPPSVTRTPPPASNPPMSMRPPSSNMDPEEVSVQEAPESEDSDWGFTATIPLPAAVGQPCGSTSHSEDQSDDMFKVVDEVNSKPAPLKLQARRAPAVVTRTEGFNEPPPPSLEQTAEDSFWNSFNSGTQQSSDKKRSIVRSKRSVRKALEQDD
eukprot:Blabericola_migrator_1__2800@NODE_17_length_22983_cov_74_609923_g14_i0_p4_GENE_NODE_17_length_22983_cov_74_609923_g14_i0NODE_17_length_22983_cov_74_609923_g14_i0_p4_ORF_typecomplete_len766_score128_01Pkinase/PF00069_25/2e09Pkinase_Tyr/PF07714_17/3_3e07Cnd1/PF12717_7/0_00011Cnd1/PF12717_7/5_5CLASP_N/PF12348_8/0_96CLASP_N/PF12348_8/0_029Adaptin_N/PF01602_20/1_6e02Adaptin_N/PF01602_20/0_00035HEAT_2/PF13646_6/0_72Kinaselike/PF14531_6/0_18Kinaselike/PF14531_6/1_6e03Arm_2/PF04826_13/0_16ParcG/PF10274_